MDWLLGFQDYLIVAVAPLVVLTAVSLVKNWRSVSDKNVTRQDRDLLMRVAVFLMLPIAVFFHEMGHALATVAFGGRVVEFHYMLLWGHVVPEGTFTQSQILFIYLAGNLVELCLGILALVVSLLVSSPPLITALTYFGIWAVGSTIALYPALSLTGAYGDWTAIYATPLSEWKLVIGFVHVLLLAALGFCLYDESMRLRFIKRTNLTWSKAFELVQADLAQQANLEDYLRLAWLFFEVGLNRSAQQIVTKNNLATQNNAEACFLQGLLWLASRKTAQAVDCFQNLLKDPELSPDLNKRVQKALELSRQGR
jgi:hypothetical protein